MNMQAYFITNAQWLHQTYDAFRTTRHGLAKGLPPWDFKHYREFRELPLLDPEDVDFNDLFIPGDDLFAFVTSGASGHKKTVYRDIGTIVRYPDEMNAMLSEHATVFLHSRRRSGESYYETHDINHRRMYPRATLAEYESREDLLRSVQEGDVLFIVEYPLMAEWVCYQLEAALNRGEVTPSDLRKRRVYLELSGEPMSRDRVARIVGRLERLFGCGVESVLTYGSNEIGHIGTCFPDSEIVYEVIPSVLVELCGREIVITPHRKHGTILFRYKIGDAGKLFFRDDKPFLEVIGKSSDEGVVYVAGAQLDIPGLASELGDSTHLPIGIVCAKKEDPTKGECQLTIIIHSPEQLKCSLEQQMKSITEQYIERQAVLTVEQHLGMVDIEVGFSTEPLRKRWFIVG